MTTTIARDDAENLVLPGLTGLLREAADATALFVAEAKPAVLAHIAPEGGKVDRKLADVHQHRVHGYGWYAAYAELLNQVAGWAERLEAEGRFGEIEALLAQLLFSEYCAQLVGGVPMNQGEIIRPAHLVEDPAILARLSSSAAATLIAEGGTQAVKSRVAQRLADLQSEPLEVDDANRADRLQHVPALGRQLPLVLAPFKVGRVGQVHLGRSVPRDRRRGDIGVADAAVGALVGDECAAIPRHMQLRGEGVLGEGAQGGGD